eukprot:3762774-Amphidinium_carterae.1
MLEEEGVGQVHGMKGADIDKDALPVWKGIVVRGSVQDCASHEVVVDKPILLPLRDGTHNGLGPHGTTIQVVKPLIP